jgi:hypothetical protein
LNIPLFEASLNATALTETQTDENKDGKYQNQNTDKKYQNQVSDVFFDATNQTDEGGNQLNQVSDVSFVATNQTDLEGKFSKSKKICAVIKTYMLNNK